MSRTHDADPGTRTAGIEHEAEFQRGMEKHFLRRAMDLAADGELDLSLAALGVSRTAGEDAEALAGIMVAEQAEADRETRLAANDRMGGLLREMMLNTPFPQIELDEAGIAAMREHLASDRPIVILNSHDAGPGRGPAITPFQSDILDGMAAHRPEDFPHETL